MPEKQSPAEVEQLTPRQAGEFWMSRAACKPYEPEVFFPSDGVGVNRAQQICKSCVVRNICLEFALSQQIDHGVWGGASERERRRILKRRRIDVA